MATVAMQLTSSSVPDDLAVVHLRVAVEGVVDERRFEARPKLKYIFAWDRRNGYNQKVYGIVTARGESDFMTKPTNSSRLWHHYNFTVHVFSIQSTSASSTHPARASSGTARRPRLPDTI